MPLELNDVWRINAAVRRTGYVYALQGETVGSVDLIVRHAAVGAPAHQMSSGPAVREKRPETTLDPAIAECPAFAASSVWRIPLMTVRPSLTPSLAIHI